MPASWPESQKEYLRACRSIPGGVNSPARAFGAVGGHPILVAEAEGAYLTDIDGNQYVDFVGSWGPLILGHQPPTVLASLEKAVRRGTTYGAPTVAESEFAELVIDAIPSVEMVRLVSSGTEASMSAVRLARGFTGRQKIVKFAGCYHGHVDCLLVAAGSGATTLGVPTSPGVPPGCTQDTIVLEFNDLNSVHETFAAKGSEIAGVILEPVVGNMGLVPPLSGFLEGLRELTARHGSLLIFDEVMTGFRLAYGGAQERFGVTPDLTVFGKIIGGGLPVGAYGGRRDVMETVSPSGPVYQAGTLSGNPLAVAAGLATLAQLRDHPPYERLEVLSRRLARGLDEAATRHGIDHQVARVGSMLTLFFHPGPVHDYAAATQSDTKRFAQFFWKMLERGVYLPCSQFEAMFVSAAHGEKEIDATIESAEASFEEIARGKLSPLPGSQ